MPYLTGTLVDRILAARGDPGQMDVDAVGVRHGGRPEPLVCALRVEPARAAVARRLAAGQYKASGLLADDEGRTDDGRTNGLRVTWVDEPDARTLVNVNTPADLC
jgi:molybdopterin-guanine dinucleotide biosynthesis protein A